MIVLEGVSDGSIRKSLLLIESKFARHMKVPFDEVMRLILMLILESFLDRVNFDDSCVYLLWVIKRILIDFNAFFAHFEAMIKFFQFVLLSVEGNLHFVD